MSSAGFWPLDYFGTYPQGAFLPETVGNGSGTDCAAVVEYGGEGIGPETLGGTWYPLVQPSADIRHILADACLTLPATVTYAHPLRIVWLSGVDRYFGDCASTTLPNSPPSEPGGNIAAFDSGLVLPTYTQRNGADVVIYDANNAVVFDSTTSTQYLTSAYGPRLRVHQWTLPDRVLRLTQHTGFANLQVAYKVPHVITPARAVLDERVSEYQCACVTGLEIYGTSLLVTGSAGALTNPLGPGIVGLHYGWNVTTYPGTPVKNPGIVNYSPLLLTCSPNSGFGRAPAQCDNQKLPISSIAGATADAYGALRLAGDPCYWVRPAVTLANNQGTVTPNKLVIGNDCQPCCDCPDYAAVGMGVNYVFGQFQTVGATAEAVRDTLKAGLQRWTNLEVLQAPGSIQGRFLVHHTQYVDGVLQVCNASPNCLPGDLLTVTCTLTQAGVPHPTIQYLFVPQTAYITNLCGELLPCPVQVDTLPNNNPSDPGYLIYTLDGSNNPATWNITFYKLQPRSFGRIRFRLQFVGLDLTKATQLTLLASVGGGSPYSTSFTVQVV